MNNSKQQKKNYGQKQAGGFTEQHSVSENIPMPVSIDSYNSSAQVKRPNTIANNKPSNKTALFDLNGVKINIDKEGPFNQNNHPQNSNDPKNMNYIYDMLQKYAGEKPQSQQNNVYNNSDYH